MADSFGILAWEIINRLAGHSYACLGWLQATPFALVKQIVVLYSYNAPRWAFGFAGRGELDICADVTGMPSTSLLRAGTAFCDEALNNYIVGRSTIVVTIALVILVMNLPLLFSRIRPLKRNSTSNNLGSNSAEGRRAMEAVRQFAATAANQVNGDMDVSDERLAERLRSIHRGFMQLDDAARVKINQTTLITSDLGIINS